MALVLPDDHDSLRAKTAAGAAIAADTLHVVLLPGDGRNDRTANETLLRQSEEHVYAFSAVLGAGEDPLDIGRRDPEQGVLWERAVLKDPRHGGFARCCKPPF
jgi:hypothetical protein